MRQKRGKVEQNSHSHTTQTGKEKRRKNTLATVVLPSPAFSFSFGGFENTTKNPNKKGPQRKFLKKGKKVFTWRNRTETLFFFFF